MADTRIINKFGEMQGWNSITTNMLGRDLEGVTKLQYNDSEEKENVYGAGKYPIGRSRGNYSPECTVGLLKEERDALQASLSEGKRLQDIAPFDIIVEYERQDGSIQKDIIKNAEFTNNAVDVSQNDGTIASDHEMIVSHIIWNAA